MTDKPYSDQALRFVREQSKKSLYFFGKEVLGYDDADPEPHLRLCRFIENPYKRRLLIGARGIYKSSFGTIARAMQILLINPNARILIVQNIKDNAKLSVKQIKEHFETNEKVRQLFGDQIPAKRKRWSTDELMLNRSRIFSEPSIKAAGCDTQLASTHWTHIIGDDIVAAERDDYREGGLIILRPEEVAKAIGWYTMTMEGLQINTGDAARDTDVCFIVNRWGVEDFAAHVIANDRRSKSNPTGFEVQEFHAYSPDGSLLWPKGLPQEKLDAIRRRQGDFMYFTQYLGKPYNPSSRGFPEEHNTYWEGKYPPGYEQDPSRWKVYLLMDMADVKKAASCFTGIIVVFVDENYHFWVGEALEQQLDTSEKLRVVHRLMKEYGIRTLHVEENLHKDLLKWVIREAKDQANMEYGLVMIKSKNASKEARIMRLQPHHENRALHLKKSQTRLLSELRDFPFCARVDVLDTLGYVPSIVPHPPKYIAEEETHYEMPTMITAKQIKDSIDSRRDAWGGGGRAAGLFSAQTTAERIMERSMRKYNEQLERELKGA